MSEVAVAQGWLVTPLEDCIDFVIGGDWGKAPEFEDETFQEVKCIRGSEFRRWKAEKGKTASLRKVKPSSLEKRALKKGDILLEISGGGPDQPVGRTEVIDKSVLAHDCDVPKVPTNFLRLIRPSSSLSSEYLNYYLKSFYMSGEVIRYQSGSNNLRNLQFKDYVKIGVPLPPLNEQTRIANKLDELLAQVDTIKARVDAIPTILKRFRQSVLAAAVSGKLTEEWRANQSELEIDIDCISREHADFFKAKGKKYKKPESMMEREQNNLFDLPSSWRWLRAEEICDLITKGTTPKKDKMSSAGDVPYIKVYNLTFDGRLDFTVEPTFVGESVHLKELARSKVYPGDVLMNIVGPPLGKVSVVPDTYPEWNINQAISIFRPVCGVSSAYLSLCLQNSSLLEIVKAKAKATAGQFNLTLEICRNYPVPVPSFDEQEEIIRRVKQLFIFADQVEQRVTDAQSRIDSLTQSILAKAFRGELVPQDPDDEPASELLARIKKERGEAAALAKAAKKEAKKSGRNRQLEIIPEAKV